MENVVYSDLSHHRDALFMMLIMKTIHQIPFTALGIGAAFTVLWGVADPMAANAELIEAIKER